MSLDDVDPEFITQLVSFISDNPGCRRDEIVANLEADWDLDDEVLDGLLLGNDVPISRLTHRWAAHRDLDDGSDEVTQQIHNILMASPFLSAHEITVALNEFGWRFEGEEVLIFLDDLEGPFFPYTLFWVLDVTDAQRRVHRPLASHKPETLTRRKSDVAVQNAGSGNSLDREPGSREAKSSPSQSGSKTASTPDALSGNKSQFVQARIAKSEKGWRRKFDDQALALSSIVTLGQAVSAVSEAMGLPDDVSNQLVDLLYGTFAAGEAIWGDEPTLGYCRDTLLQFGTPNRNDFRHFPIQQSDMESIGSILRDITEVSSRQNVGDLVIKRVGSVFGGTSNIRAMEGAVLTVAAMAIQIGSEDSRFSGAADRERKMTLLTQFCAYFVLLWAYERAN